MSTAKELINKFCQKEYEHDADFSDMENIAVAYTTTEDEKHEIQVYIDLVNLAIKRVIDNNVTLTKKCYKDMNEFIDEELSFLDFGELVYVDDEEWEAIENGGH